jgi:hypothetical protein
LDCPFGGDSWGCFHHRRPRPQPLILTRLAVYDGKTHYILWTVTDSIELAHLQKTHDKNFDAALTEVLNQFLKIAGKPPAAAH